ncbi:MAG: CoA transferase [Acidimicrobiia bacterium]|nr:CoA transferase [Acidimicrobiia bacterium]
MSRPLEGVKVVELGLWLAGPACATILADWGAEVTKIEPLAGDPFRGYAWVWDNQLNPPFELDNRGKRAIAVDLRTETGLRIALDLLAEADVFVTNYRPGGLERLGLDWQCLHAHNPRLVYASVTGYGLRGEERDRASYDMGAFWSRAGVGAALTAEGMPLPYQRGGMGDHVTGLGAAGGVSAALFQRERTGLGELVEISLLRVGMYFIGTDVNTSLRTGAPTVGTAISEPPNPLLTGYECADGRMFWLLCLEGDRHWPLVIAALEAPGLAEDERFATMEARLEHAPAVTAELQRIFRTRDRGAWAEAFDREGVWWAPVQHAHELVDDPQVEAAHGLVDVPLADGTTARMVASPVDFGGVAIEVRRGVPELGQDTELVLVELGRTWEEIDRLKAAGVIR